MAAANYSSDIEVSNNSSPNQTRHKARLVIVEDATSSRTSQPVLVHLTYVTYNIFDRGASKLGWETRLHSPLNLSTAVVCIGTRQREANEKVVRQGHGARGALISSSYVR